MKCRAWSHTRVEWRVIWLTCTTCGGRVFSHSGQLRRFPPTPERRRQTQDEYPTTARVRVTCRTCPITPTRKKVYVKSGQIRSIIPSRILCREKNEPKPSKFLKYDVYLLFCLFDWNEIINHGAPLRHFVRNISKLDLFYIRNYCRTVPIVFGAL